MTGPGHFVANADMAARRAHIAGLIRAETWKPDRDLPAARGTSRVTPPSRWITLPIKLTLNGHLLPFFGRFGRRVEVDIRERGLLWPVWGAREALYRDPEGGRFYVVRHDKARFMRLLWRMLRLRPAPALSAWPAVVPPARFSDRPSLTNSCSPTPRTAHCAGACAMRGSRPQGRRMIGLLLSSRPVRVVR